MENIIRVNFKTRQTEKEEKILRFSQLKIKKFNDSFINNEEEELEQLSEWIKIHR